MLSKEEKNEMLVYIREGLPEDFRKRCADAGQSLEVKVTTKTYAPGDPSTLVKVEVTTYKSHPGGVVGEVREYALDFLKRVLKLIEDGNYPTPTPSSLPAEAEEWPEDLRAEVERLHAQARIRKARLPHDKRRLLEAAGSAFVRLHEEKAERQFGNKNDSLFMRLHKAADPIRAYKADKQREKRHQAEALSLDQTVKLPNGEEVSPYEALADPRASLDRVDERVFWGDRRGKLESSLTKQEREAFRLRMAGYTGKEIADIMGISEPRVSQLNRQVEEKARKLN